MVTICQRVYENDEFGWAEYPDELDDVYNRSNQTTPRPVGIPAGQTSIRSVRTHRDLPCSPISEEERMNLAKNPEYREDFHNYNQIDSHPDSLGRCRCELRIVTGDDCLHHFQIFNDDDVFKVPDSAKDHWQWYVDVAPRHQVCPLVVTRIRRGLGFSPCHVVDEGIAPTTEWVLAIGEGALEGTIPVRLDQLITGKCFRCDPRYAGLVSDNNHVDLDHQIDSDLAAGQMHKLWKFHSPNPDRTVTYQQPIMYKPESGKSAHWSLEVGAYYHMDDIRDIPGVTEADFFITEGGMTYKEYCDEANGDPDADIGDKTPRQNSPIPQQ